MYDTLKEYNINPYGYTCLDIGDSVTKLVKMTLINDKLYVSGLYSCPTRGVNDAERYSKSEFIDCIEELFNEAKKDIDEDIHDVILVLPSSLLRTYRQQTELRITNPRGICSDDDIISIKSKFNKDFIQNKEKEVVYAIYPFKYLKDGYPTSDIPVGYKCQKIGLEAFVPTLPKSTSTVFHDCLNDLGINVIDTILSPTANYAVVDKNKTLDKCVIVDIGGKHTLFSYFYKGILIHHFSVDNGTKYIQEELMKEFSLSDEEAKEVYEKYASTMPNEYDSVVYKTSDGRGIKENDIITSVQTSLQHILSKLKNEGADALKSLDDSSLIYIVGGGAYIKRVENIFHDVLVKTAYIKQYDKIGGREHLYTTAIGAILTYVNKESRLQYASQY